MELDSWTTGVACAANETRSVVGGDGTSFARDEARDEDMEVRKGT